MTRTFFRAWLASITCTCVLVLLPLGYAPPTAAHVALPSERSEPRAELEFVPAPVAGPFDHPWSIGFLPDGTMLVTERAGRLLLVRPGGQTRAVENLPTMLVTDHAGPLDVAVDPGFARNRTIYMSYAHGTEEQSTLRVMRARLDVARARLSDRRVIFDGTPAESTQIYGGRIALDGKGNLYLTLGDRWDRWRAQSVSDHAGSIVRIRTEGGVSPDNPFVSDPEARSEIWSYGHRNPLGIAFDSRNGVLWSHENGPRGGDELNVILPGRNYGWPVISHGLEYEGDGDPIGVGAEWLGMEQALHHWTPAIAPSGLAVEYEGDATVLWIGALTGQSLIRLTIEGGRIVDEQRLLHEEIGRIRDVAIGPDGLLYVVVDDEEGRVYRLDPVVVQAGRGHGGGAGRL